MAKDINIDSRSGRIRGRLALVANGHYAATDDRRGVGIEVANQRRVLIDSEHVMAFGQPSFKHP